MISASTLNVFEGTCS